MPSLPKTKETIHKYKDNFKQYSFDVQTVVDVVIDVQTVVNKFQSFYRSNKCNPLYLFFFCLCFSIIKQRGGKSNLSVGLTKREIN